MNVHSITKVIDGGHARCSLQCHRIKRKSNFGLHNGNCPHGSVPLNGYLLCHKSWWKCSLSFSFFQQLKLKKFAKIWLTFVIWTVIVLYFIEIIITFKNHRFTYPDHWGIKIFTIFRKFDRITTAIDYGIGLPLGVFNITYFIWWRVFSRFRHFIYNYLYHHCFCISPLRCTRISKQRRFSKFYEFKCRKTKGKFI